MAFRVLLVSPKAYPHSVADKTTEYKLYPYSVVYLVNYLRKRGLCEADYLDLTMQTDETLFESLRQTKFDLIGFTSTPEARFLTMDLIRRARELAPEAFLIAGGAFFSKVPEQALQHVQELDAVAVGEGERTLAELVIALTAGQGDLSDIAGLCHRRNGVIVINAPREPIRDLAEVEIDYDLVSKPEYDQLFPMKNWEDHPEKNAFCLMLGRGCNNRCVFCINRFLPYRVFRADAVLRQIRQIIDRFGIRHFMFTEPSFCERQEFVREFCQRLIEEKLEIEWYCEGRADVKPDLLDLMRRAGCISMDFALESGSPKVLKALNKGIDLPSLLVYARHCRDLGIRLRYFAMISLPEERPEDVLKTYDVICQLADLGVSGYGVAPLIIYPGTDLEVMARQKGILPEDFSWFDASYSCPYSFVQNRARNMPHYLEYLTEQQVVESRQLCEQAQRRAHRGTRDKQDGQPDRLRWVLQRIRETRDLPTLYWRIRRTGYRFSKAAGRIAHRVRLLLWRARMRNR